MTQEKTLLQVADDLSKDKAQCRRVLTDLLSRGPTVDTTKLLGILLSKGVVSELAPAEGIVGLFIDGNSESVDILREFGQYFSQPVLDYLCDYVGIDKISGGGGSGGIEVEFCVPVKSVPVPVPVPQPDPVQPDLVPESVPVPEPELVAEPEAVPETVDLTNSKLNEIKKKFYLVIKSTLSTDEAAHRLLSLPASKTHPYELVHILTECCTQEKVYSPAYSNIALALCQVGYPWPKFMSKEFENVYNTVHDKETLAIQNLGTFFGFLLANKGIDWKALAPVWIGPNQSTPSNRIFLQSLFTELNLELGKEELCRQFSKAADSSAPGLFPAENEADLRFCINYFTVIGLGYLTDPMRLLLPP